MEQSPQGWESAYTSLADRLSIAVFQIENHLLGHTDDIRLPSISRQLETLATQFKNKSIGRITFKDAPDAFLKQIESALDAIIENSPELFTKK